MNAQEFGEYLKSLRKSKKLTIRQLDLYSSVSNSYISQMERGARGIPSPDILQKLSKPLGVSYEELMAKAGYLDKGDSKFEDLLHKVYMYFIPYMKGEQTKERVVQIMRGMGEDEQRIKSIKENLAENIDSFYDEMTFDEKLEFLHIFLDTHLKNTKLEVNEEDNSNEILDKYNHLSTKKREAVDNMIDMLYSDQ